jgi:putative addiction module component (TIGR02574 family)
MNTDAHNLLDQALSLPDGDRAALAASLLQSLDDHVDSDLDAAWDVEIKRRIAEIDNGDVELVPWESVMAKMKQRING